MNKALGIIAGLALLLPLGASALTVNLNTSFSTNISVDGYEFKGNVSCEGKRCTTHVSPGSNIHCPLSSTVYYIGYDGKRYTHVNGDSLYRRMSSMVTDQVLTIDCEDLDMFPSGGNLHLKPGMLIKNQIDPKVYAVQSNGILRHIKDEATATALFGSEWAKRVVDFPEIFFPKYTYGEVLTANDTPDGYIGMYDDQLAVSFNGQWYLQAEGERGAWGIAFMLGASPKEYEFRGDIKERPDSIELFANSKEYPTFEMQARYYGLPFNESATLHQADFPVVPATYDMP